MSPSRAGGVPIRDVHSDPWELLRILNKLKLLLLDSLYYIPKWSHSVMSGLCDPMDCSLPGSSIHGIFQARILEWVAISFSRRSSQPRDWTWVSHIVGRCFTIWATREVDPHLHTLKYSLVAQMVRNLSVMQETWVQSLGQEDPLQKGITTFSSILAWKISWTKELGGLQSTR